MSGMYVLLLIALWLGVGLLMLRLWRRLGKESIGTPMRAGAGVLLLAAWVGAPWYYAFGRKALLDVEVRELCAKDGGIKVYETVKLPAEKFDEWGMVNFYRPTQGESALGPEYVFRVEDNSYRKGYPTLMRHHYQITRRADNKLLGETVSYGRGGGDLPGPWFPSSFTCPDVVEAGPNALLKAVFVRNNTGE